MGGLRIGLGVGIGSGNRLPPYVDMQFLYEGFNVAETPYTFNQLITFTRTSAATYVNSAGNVVSAPAGTPRFDYDPVTLQPRGLLIEEQRTNLFTNSEFPNGVSDAPTRGGNVSATTFSLVPGNTGLAINNTGPVTSFAYKTNFTPVVSTTYTISAFIRMDDGNAPSFGSTVTTASANSFVLVIAGIAVNPTTYTVTAMGNGFYRVSATATAASVTINNGVLKYNTNDSRSFTFSGIQFEAGAFATSYIPTVASQVTRAADQASIVAPNFAPWYNQSEGTFVAEWSSITTSASVANFSDGTTNNRITVQNDNGFQGAVLVGGATQASLDGGTLAAINKVALAYKANDFALSFNGGAAVTDTSGSVPTVDRLILGANGAGTASFLNGHIRRISYYPSRLSNAQLQALSA